MSKKIDKIYYDYSTKKYVEDIDTNDSSKKVLEICRGTGSGEYEETWQVKRKEKGNDIIDIVYPSSIDIDDVLKIRNMVSRENNCTLVNLVRLTSPSEEFDAIVKKMFKLKGDP